MSDTGVFLTRAAEGLDRRGFTLSEIERMLEVGILDPDEKFELIDGEIVPMSPQASPHLIMKGRIARWLAEHCPRTLEIVQDATLVFLDSLFVEPDVLVFRADSKRRYVRPDQVSLAVEVADSSLTRDLHTKAPRYGAGGVPELWVVDLNDRVTHVFRGPGSARWSEPRVATFDESIETLLLPGRTVRIADFEG